MKNTAVCSQICSYRYNTTNVANDLKGFFASIIATLNANTILTNKEKLTLWRAALAYRLSCFRTCFAQLREFCECDAIENEIEPDPNLGDDDEESKLAKYEKEEKIIVEDVYGFTVEQIIEWVKRFVGLK